MTVKQSREGKKIRESKRINKKSKGSRNLNDSDTGNVCRPVQEPDSVRKELSEGEDRNYLTG